MTKSPKATRPATDQAEAATGAATKARKARATSRTPALKASRAPRAVKVPPSKTVAAVATTLAATVPTTNAKPPRQTKAALLRDRLSAPGGASLAALTEMTGWQAHTLRAALTGLRKSGLSITRRRLGEDTIYAIEADAMRSKADGGDNACPENAAADAALTAIKSEHGA